MLHNSECFVPTEFAIVDEKRLQFMNVNYMDSLISFVDDKFEPFDICAVQKFIAIS